MAIPTRPSCAVAAARVCLALLMADTVFVTRHGARIDNGPDADRKWLLAAGHNRRDDPHLSPSGERAARELAQRLATETPRVTHIFSSPFVRCVQTANTVAEELGLGIRVEPGVSEVLTTFPPGLLSDAELLARFPRIDASYEPVVRREDLRRERGDGDAADRAGRAAADVCARLQVARPADPQVPVAGGAAQAPSCVLFVGHGASCLGIVERFGGHGYVGYTSLTRFEQEQSGGKAAREGGLAGEGGNVSHERAARPGNAAGWSLVGPLGDVSHLSDQATALRSAF